MPGTINKNQKPSFADLLRDHNSKRQTSPPPSTRQDHSDPFVPHRNQSPVKTKIIAPTSAKNQKPKNLLEFTNQYLSTGIFNVKDYMDIFLQRVKENPKLLNHEYPTIYVEQLMPLLNVKDPHCRDFLFYCYTHYLNPSVLFKNYTMEYVAMEFDTPDAKKVRAENIDYEQILLNNNRLDYHLFKSVLLSWDLFDKFASVVRKIDQEGKEISWDVATWFISDDIALGNALMKDFDNNGHSSEEDFFTLLKNYLDVTNIIYKSKPSLSPWATSADSYDRVRDVRTTAMMYIVKYILNIYSKVNDKKRFKGIAIQKLAFSNIVYEYMRVINSAYKDAETKAMLNFIYQTSIYFRKDSKDKSYPDNADFFDNLLLIFEENKTDIEQFYADTQKNKRQLLVQHEKVLLDRIPWINNFRYKFDGILRSDPTVNKFILALDSQNPNINTLPYDVLVEKLRLKTDTPEEFMEFWSKYRTTILNLTDEQLIPFCNKYTQYNAVYYWFKKLNTAKLVLFPSAAFLGTLSELADMSSKHKSRYEDEEENDIDTKGIERINKVFSSGSLDGIYSVIGMYTALYKKTQKSKLFGRLVETLLMLFYISKIIKKPIVKFALKHIVDELRLDFELLKKSLTKWGNVSSSLSVASTYDFERYTLKLAKEKEDYTFLMSTTNL